MTTVLFGNTNPMMQRTRFLVEDGQVVGTEQISVPAEHLSVSVTRIEMRDGFDDPDEVELALSTGNDRVLSMIARGLDGASKVYAVGVAEVEQIVSAHAAGDKPAWISSDDEDFQAALCGHFDCPPGEPVMLLTNGGRDLLHSQGFNTGAQGAASNYMALTANSGAPVNTDTVLTAEIATGGGGLIRAQATYAHTAGTNTTTLTKTFTANGSDALPVVVAKIGVFNAGAAGTMTLETLLNATATLTVSGDSVTITETVTLG